MEQLIFDDGSSVLRSDYTHLFYSNLPLHPCCGDCKYSRTERVADFTVADYWGVENYFPDYKYDNDEYWGISLLFFNSERGLKLMPYIKNNADIVETELSKCMQPNLKHPSYIPKASVLFWKDYHRNGVIHALMKYSRAGGIRASIRRKLLKFFKLW